MQISFMDGSRFCPLKVHHIDHIRIQTLSLLYRTPIGTTRGLIHIADLTIYSVCTVLKELKDRGTLSKANRTPHPMELNWLLAPSVVGCRYSTPWGFWPIELLALGSCCLTDRFVPLMTAQPPPNNGWSAFCASGFPGQLRLPWRTFRAVAGPCTRCTWRRPTSRVCARLDSIRW